MSFYANVFDPRLVVGQIVAMQCLGYLSLSILVWSFHEIFATSLSMSQIFGTRNFGWDSPDAMAATAAGLLNGLLLGFQLLIVVERAKKCLDFAVTFTICHFLLCWRFDGFPVDWRWWAVNISMCIFAAVSGEYLCMKKELTEINVNEFLSMRPVRAEPSTSPPTTINSVQRRPSSRPGSPDLA